MKNLVGFAIYFVVVILSYIYAFRKNKKDAKKSFKKGTKQMIKQIPFLVSIFMLVALFDQFVSKDLIVKIIGEGKGAFSALLSALLGAAAMGSVSSAYPLGGILLKKGAALTSVAIFLNSWVMVGLVTMPYEISIFGKRFAIARNTLSFVGAIIVGTIVGIIVGGLV